MKRESVKDRPTKHSRNFGTKVSQSNFMVGRLSLPQGKECPMYSTMVRITLCASGATISHPLVHSQTVTTVDVDAAVSVLTNLRSCFLCKVGVFTI